MTADGESYRFAMASAIDTSKTVNTASVVTTKNQSLICAYSTTETTTRRIGVAMRTTSPAFSSPFADGRIDVDRPEDEAGEEQRRRGDHSDEQQLPS